MTLTELLNSSLQKGIALDYFYIKAKPAPRTPSKRKQSQPLPETHLFAVFQDTLLIFALDVLVYKTKQLTTLYISKADTTGCHARAMSIAMLTECFIEQLLHQQQGRVCLTLFARSQPQYIFPCSSQNKRKHVLSDRGLVQWWIHILDRLKMRFEKANGFVLVPGAEDAEVRRTYLQQKQGWQAGHPYAASGLARDLILKFPDDPKARFLDQLAADKALDTTTVEQFWQLMAHRQEMSSGRSIAFLTLGAQLPAIDAHSAASETTDFVELDDKKLGMLRDALEAQTYATIEETRAASEHWRRVVSSKAGANTTPVAVHGTVETQVAAVDTNAGKPSEPHILTVRKRKKEDAPQVHVLVPRKKVPKPDPGKATS